jgi:hypothetical protein
MKKHKQHPKHPKHPKHPEVALPLPVTLPFGGSKKDRKFKINVDQMAEFAKKHLAEQEKTLLPFNLHSSCLQHCLQQVSLML